MMNSLMLRGFTMGKNHFQHCATFLNSDFERLIATFPVQSELLQQIAEISGKKRIIWLSVLNSQIQEKLGTEIVDYLYQTAYQSEFFKFSSYYYQLNEILNLPKSKVKTILEIGVGKCYLQALLSLYEYELFTLDITDKYQPDYIADIRDMPLKSDSVDLVLAFQVLEHLPYEEFAKCLTELRRVTKRYLFISLPYKSNSFFLHINVKLPVFHKMIDIFSCIWGYYPDIDVAQFNARKDKENPHYWELGRKSFPKSRIINDILSAGFIVQKQFHNPHQPYHYYILCEKQT